MNLTRRHFVLAGSAVTGLGLIGTGLIAQAFVTDTAFRQYIRGAVSRQLPYLNVDRQTLDRFSADLFQMQRPNSKQRLAALGGGLGAWILRLIDADNVDTYERSVATTLLLNSNFFDAHEEGQPFEYYGITDGVCSTANPFAKFLT